MFKNFSNYVISWVIYQLYKTIGLTLRYVPHDKKNQELAKTYHSKQIYIIALWHKNLFSSILGHFNSPHVTMASQSRDGEIIANVLKRMNYHPARGSSSRGGRKGMIEMLEFMTRENNPMSGALTVDGPRGPAFNCKKGVVEIANHVHCAILPFAGIPEHGWRLGSWDGFVLPRPFTKVHMLFGKPIYFNKDINEENLELARKEVENELLRLENLGKNFLVNY